MKEGAVLEGSWHLIGHIVEATGWRGGVRKVGMNICHGGGIVHIIGSLYEVWRTL